MKKIFFALFILFSAAALSGCMKGPGPKAEDAGVFYQCSMHPAVTATAPGDCPICHMRLTRVDHPAASEAKKDRILFYRHPMRPEVTSPSPAKDEMGMDYIPVYESETRNSGVSVAGRAAVTIDPLRQQQIGVRITEVRRQPMVMKLRALGRAAYDPDLHNTIGEYREAVAEYIKSKSSPNMTVRERAEQVMKLAELKLRLSGISSEQMDHLKNAGQSTLRLLTLRHDASELFLPAGAAWVYVDLYENESGLVAEGQKAEISSPARPGQVFNAQVRTADLIPNAVIRTMRVRLEAEDPENLLLQGMSVDVVLTISLGDKISVPEEAVMNTGEMTLVFVSLGEGHFEPREVRVGHEAGGFYEVLAGLKEGEKIVSSASFLIDSESRIRAALQDFGGVKKISADAVSETSPAAEPGGHRHD